MNTPAANRDVSHKEQPGQFTLFRLKTKLVKLLEWLSLMGGLLW